MALNTSKCNHLTPLDLKGLSPFTDLWWESLRIGLDEEFAPKYFHESILLPPNSLIYCMRQSTSNAGCDRSATSWASRWRTCRSISTIWTRAWTRKPRRRPACVLSYSEPRPTTRRWRASTTRRSLRASRNLRRRGTFLVCCCLWIDLSGTAHKPLSPNYGRNWTLIPCVRP